ncbi:MAG: hypothetical protein DMG63_10030, partial [Acidobacteria bacterium]
MFGKQRTASRKAIVIIVGLIVWAAGCGGGGSNSFSSSPAPPPTTSNTAPGTNVSVQPTDSTGASPAKLVFSNVTQAGMTTLTIANTGVMPPIGFLVGSPAQYFDLATTAVFSGPVSVCINYSGVSFVNSPRLFHYNGSAWVDVTTSVDTTNHSVCGSVTSFSPFATFQSGTASEITSATSTAFSVNTAGTFTVTATGFPMPLLSASGRVPSGVNFDASTGVLSGTPATSGTFSLTFTAHNGIGPDAAQNFTLNVAAATQTPLSITGPSSLVYGMTGSATVSGGSGTGAVTFSAGTSTGCSVSDRTISVTNASGTCTVAATKAGDESYAPATSAPFSVMLTKATPTISWANPAAITFGDVLSATQLNAIPSVPGTFVYSPAAGTVLNAGANQSLSVTFTPTDTSNYTTQTASVTISADKADSVVTVDCTAGAPFTYSGLALTPCTAVVTGAGNLHQSLTINYTNNVNAGTATATASFAGDANHSGSSNSVNFTIAKASSTVNVDCTTGAPFTYTGSPLTPCTANATGVGNLNESLTVNYTGNVNAGTATATANFGGDANHNGRTASSSFVIGKATPTITWTNPAAITYGTALSATQLNATASVSGTFVYSPAPGTLLTASANQTLSVTFTPTDTSNYATQTASVTITVNKADSTVTVDCTSGAPFTYAGSALTPCTATAIGVGNLNQS